MNSTGRLALAGLMAGALSACSTLGASGPATDDVRDAGGQAYAESAIQVVDLDGPVLGALQSHRDAASFAQLFGSGRAVSEAIGTGDILDIAIWEAPPAVLFGSVPLGGASRSNDAGGSATIPQQQVGEDGRVSVPFVGRVIAAGRNPADLQREIRAKLRGKAHDPQVIVRRVQNEARTATVLGEVGQSRRLPLTARGERVLDAIASAGGARESVAKSTVQLARGASIATMPLQSVIADPAQNVVLQSGDIVTVLHQPNSFVALGAVNRNAEVPFEGAGLTLAEALGRVGGLNDRRADIRGVFVFRLEQPATLAGRIAEGARTTQDGRVPVIYRLNMADPASLFAMQDFAMRDDDVVYISTAPGADLQRFISTISSTAFSIVAIGNALQDGN